MWIRSEIDLVFFSGGPWIFQDWGRWFNSCRRFSKIFIKHIYYLFSNFFWWGVTYVRCLMTTFRPWTGDQYSLSASTNVMTLSFPRFRRFYIKHLSKFEYMILNILYFAFKDSQKGIVFVNFGRFDFELIAILDNVEK